MASSFPSDSALALFGKAKFAALKALLKEPFPSLHLREIARLCQVSPSAITRELESLTAAGILSESRIANLRMFRANPDNPVTNALVTLVRELESSAESVVVHVRTPVRRKSEALGLSAPYDWSNPNINDDALIAKTAGSLRFEDIARVCRKYGMPRVRKVIEENVNDPIAVKILARQLKNIEAAQGLSS
jgi:DNA-binding transcriptional ArsR family regulator